VGLHVLSILDAVAPKNERSHLIQLIKLCWGQRSDILNSDLDQWVAFEASLNERTVSRTCVFGDIMHPIHS
jgi:hypothetical protein